MRIIKNPIGRTLFYYHENVSAFCIIMGVCLAFYAALGFMGAFTI